MRAALVVLLAACASEPPPGKLELIEAPPGGDVEPIIIEELAKATGSGDALLVYVGASWCEPCRAFHEAAAAGSLDDKLSRLRLLEFDADRDTEALEAAGYRSNLIPLFAVPRADGRSTGKQTEGAIKNRDAVSQLVPRVRALLGR